MRRTFACVAWSVAALLSGCAPAPAEPDARLVAALVDVHLLDARRAALGDSLGPSRAATLRHHGLTEASFETALVSLARRPEDYTATLAAVNERLSTRLRTLPELSTPAPMLMAPDPPPPHGPPPPP